MNTDASSGLYQKRKDGTLFPANVTTSSFRLKDIDYEMKIISSISEQMELEKKLNFSVFPESQGGPLMHVIAAKAVCFKEAMSDEFKTYQQQVLDNARAMAKGFMDRGFDVVSNGTDDHLFLLSLIKQEITGKDADAALGRANITVNKNRSNLVSGWRSRSSSSGTVADSPTSWRLPVRSSASNGPPGAFWGPITPAESPKKGPRLEHPVLLRRGEYIPNVSA